MSLEKARQEAGAAQTPQDARPELELSKRAPEVGKCLGPAGVNAPYAGALSFSSASVTRTGMMPVAESWPGTMCSASASQVKILDSGVLLFSLYYAWCESLTLKPLGCHATESRAGRVDLTRHQKHVSRIAQRLSFQCRPRRHCSDHLPRQHRLARSCTQALAATDGGIYNEHRPLISPDQRSLNSLTS